jgi:FAD dependent oxidoreductase TIGR03364
VTPAEAGRLAPIPTGELVGALHAELDLRVDPREAVAGLARLLEQDPEAHVEWSAPVHELEPGAVHATGLTVRTPAIIVCPGPGYGSLPPSCREGLSVLTLCKLQMLRIAAPSNRRYGPALVTGLSLIRYPAFAFRPGASALRRRLAAERPELLGAGIHLLVTQLPGGDLIVGDTHEYGDAPSPFRDERLDELLLAEAGRLLGADALQVRERWIGIYPTTGDGHADGTGHFVVTAPFDGARVVEVVSGLGMTMVHGYAGGVLDQLALDRVG